jgi:thymidine kinase
MNSNKNNLNLKAVESAATMDVEEGYLELWTGPMFSGKTSKILEIYKQFNFCGISTCVINYEEDNRYPNAETHLSTHDKTMIPCIRSTSMTEIADIIGGSVSGSNNINNNIDDNSNLKRKETLSGKYVDKFLESKVILINEGQFFLDIVEWVKIAVDVYHKKVYICGLDGDFERKSFNGDWLNLIPYCDKVKKLHSYCSNCKSKPAIFSHRLINETAQKVIGVDSYIPLCRKCYLQLSLNN